MAGEATRVQGFEQEVEIEGGIGFFAGSLALGHNVVATAAAGELHMAAEIHSAHMLLRECCQSTQ